MCFGVPQGSVLGPFLWNTASDAVLCTSLPPGLRGVCYLDDTLILARGTSFKEVLWLLEQGMACVVSKICELGLRVAPLKTELTWFRRLRKR